MLKNKTINLKVVEKVALALEEINNDVIYVGGAVVSLYVTDDGAELPRPTTDIDISVQISSYAQMEQLRKKLASKKVYPASTESVLYRFVYEEILIDFIPFEETSLGPTNKWLKPGFQKYNLVTIGNAKIKILPVSLFLASKWEAYKSRGGDPRMSKDFEDIVYIIDNNKNLVNEIQNADNNVQTFLYEMSNKILSNSSLNEIIECHINPYTAEERRELIIEKLKKIKNLRDTR